MANARIRLSTAQPTRVSVCWWGRVRARKVSPEDLFVAADLGFDDGAAMIAAGFFPRSTAPFTDGSDRLIARQRLGFAVAMLLNLGVFARRNDRTHRRSPVWRGQRLKHLAPIIGSIPAHRSDGGFDLIQQRLDLPRIILAIRRQGLCHDLAGGFIHAEVQFAPRAPLVPAVLTHLPLAFAIHLQPRRVDDQVQGVDPWAV